MGRGLELTLRGRMLMTLASAAVFAAWLTGHDHIRLAAALLAAPLLIDLLWKGARVSGLQVAVPERHTPAGMPFLEHLTLHNPRRQRAIHDLHLREPSTTILAGGAVFEHLPPAESVSLRIPARARKRGIHAERIFLVTTSHPLGFIRRRAVLRVATTLVVEPARVDLPPHVMHAFEEDKHDAASRTALGHAEFHSLREYSAGEDARLVHAIKSAGCGALVAKVTHGEERPSALVVLDLRRPPGQILSIKARRFEWSLGATARLVDEMQERDARVEVLVLGREEELICIDDQASAADFFTLLAGAKPVEHHPLTGARIQAIRDHATCYWVPAGGFRAREDRSLLRDPILVSEVDRP